MMESFGVVLRWKKSGTRVQLPQETLRRQLSRSLREFSIVLFHFNRSPTDRRMRNPLKQLKSVRHRQSSALLNYFQLFPSSARRQPTPRSKGKRTTFKPMVIALAFSSPPARIDSFIISVGKERAKAAELFCRYFQLAMEMWVNILSECSVRASTGYQLIYFDFHRIIIRRSVPNACLSFRAFCFCFINI